MIKKIADIYAEKMKIGDPVFSFEVFPPKTSEGIENLFGTIEELAELEPDYISVTYGAGGSTTRSTLPGPVRDHLHASFYPREPDGRGAQPTYRAHARRRSEKCTCPPR
jgi:hypothetical protein